MMMRAALALALVSGVSAGAPNPWTGPTDCETEGCFVWDGSVVGASGAAEIAAGLLFDNEPLWLNSKTEFREVPEFMKGMLAIKPGLRIEGKKTFAWQCGKRGKSGCTAFMFQYKCAGCEFEEGDFNLVMDRQGWEPFYCAPKFDAFTQPVDFPNLHPMMAWSKNVAAGQTISVTLNGPETEYIVMVVDLYKQLIDCSTLQEPGKCLDKKYKGQCYWDVESGVCINNTCRRKFTGPGGDGRGTCAARCVGLDFQ